MGNPLIFAVDVVLAQAELFSLINSTCINV